MARRVGAGKHSDPEPFLVPRFRVSANTLMDSKVDGTSATVRFLNNPDSLLSFTRLKPDEDSILEFAQRFGGLGVEQQIVFLGAENDPKPHWGESLRSWRYEWYDLHFVDLVWRACQDREAPDVDTLSKFFRWIEIPAGPRRAESYCAFTAQHVSTLSNAVEPGEKFNILTCYEDDPHGLPYALEQDDLLTAARLYLALEVQSHLENRATLRLLADSVQGRQEILGDTKHLVAMTTRWDSKRLKPMTVLRPTSLLGVMWLEFQRNLEGNVAFRQCGFCDTWFKPKRERGQRAKWCSGSCRTQAFYRDNGGRIPKKTRV
jgi:hypothetical protein